MEQHPEQKTILSAAFLPLLACVVPLVLLAPVLGYGFVWDDLWLVVENPHVTGLTSWWEALRADAYQGYYWRPLVIASLRLDWWLGGGTAGVFHAVNLLLFGFCLVLLGRLLKAHGLSPMLQAAVLVLWGLHPTKVEPVAFISARDNLLLGVLVLLALLETHALMGALPRISRVRLARLLLWLGLALLVKEAAVLLVPLIAWRLLADEQARPGRGRLFAGVLAGWLVLLLLYLVARHGVLGGGDALSARESTVLHALAMPVYLLSHYLRIWFWPFPLLADRFDSTLWNAGNLAALWPHALLAGLFVVVCIRCWFKNRAAAYWLGLFVLLLAPVLNLLPTPGRLTSDTWLFLPSIGLAAGLVLLLHPLLLRLGRWRLARGIPALLMVGLAGLWAVLQVIYLPAWSSEPALYHHVLRHQPENPRPYFWLGGRALDAGENEKARLLFQAGLQANPRFGDNLMGLALVDVRDGRRDEAARRLEDVLRREAGHEGAAYYRARLALEAGDAREALDWADRTTQIRRFPERLWVQAEAYRALGEQEKALRHLAEFCRHRPGFPICHPSDARETR